MTKLSGGFNNYYLVKVKHPQRENQEPYMAECEDIIQALGMTFDEGCAFKALWRSAAARMGNGKPGNKAVYDAEKLVHYSNRILNKERLGVIMEPFTVDSLDFEKALGEHCWIYTGGKVPDFSAIPRSVMCMKAEYITQTGAKCIARLNTIGWSNVVNFRILPNESN